MMKSKKWGVLLVVLTVLSLCIVAASTALIDPFFHYHKPLDFLQYPINDQRYQNDGIVKHFDYDALITGTSLTENFLASQFDTLFGVNSVKVCFSGSTYTELNANLRRAIDANPDIRLVLFGLDSWFLFEGKGAMRTDAAYPYYLYDSNPLNDVEYLLNKEVLCSRAVDVLEYTRQGGTTTNFDSYSFWGSSDYGKTGREIALANAPREPLTAEATPFSQADRQNVAQVITENAVQLARENPDIQFLYFFPPYSILYWDKLARSGTMDRQLEAWTLASELLLKEENIRLFSFYQDFDTALNLDNYRDDVHYGSDINAQLLQRMARGEYQLTEDNYLAHWQDVADFYKACDYDALYR